MSFTLTIIVITIITSIYAWNNSNVFLKWMMHPYQVYQSGQYYRFITSGLIHSGYGHLAFNMITFYFFGGFVEKAFKLYLGSWGVYYFVALYVLGIVISDIPSYFKHRTNVNYSAIGASGGVSAVLFSSILINPVMDICLYFFICLPGFVLGALYLIYSVYMGNRMSDNINHDAHMYGAMFGIVFSAIIRPAFMQEFLQQLFRYSPF